VVFESLVCKDARVPELPDVTVYVERIAERVVNHRLEQVRIRSPFVLRTAVPPIDDATGKQVTGVRRLGKRIVFGLEGERFIVIHLMIAGRFQWLTHRKPISGRAGLAAFDFSSGTLLLTEAGTRKRASIHYVTGSEALTQFDRGGIEVFESEQPMFERAMTQQRHTLKRALTDPTILSGIGNAYSDEILHRAQLSPLQMTDRVTSEQWTRLFTATREVLDEWTTRLRTESGHGFPEKVTAFRKEMAVHGRFGQPCPRCQTPVQRIVYASNETNYCPTCQTNGRLLADRSLSRLMHDDWPRTLEELEERKAGSR
jgi:formamidopyrimidine-DNA glycosylase